MTKILGCIDGSLYADGVCTLISWAQARLQLPVTLLHVVTPSSVGDNPIDMTGQIGLGAKSDLLQALAEIDAAHGKLALKKGQLMLSHAQALLAANGIAQPEILHWRGRLVDTIATLESELDLIIMGKRGEQHQTDPAHLGSNLERVARTIHKPLLLATQQPKPIERILIAYDGSASAQKTLDYVASSALFKGLEVHLLNVGNDSAEATASLAVAEEKLTAQGLSVIASLQSGEAVVTVATVVRDYLDTHAIDLLAIGAYGHSKIRRLILGSTTTALIQQSQVPVLLCR